MYYLSQSIIFEEDKIYYNSSEYYLPKKQF